MPRGGWRPGAGKPKGSKNRRTREAAERIAAAAGRAIAASVASAAAATVTATAATATAPEAELLPNALPLDVMVTAMRAHLAAARQGDGRIDLREMDKAAAIAKDAAPYIHPRLVSSPGTGDKETVVVVRGGLGEPPRSEHGN